MIEQNQDFDHYAFPEAFRSRFAIRRCSLEAGADPTVSSSFYHDGTSVLGSILIHLTVVRVLYPYQFWLLAMC